MSVWLGVVIMALVVAVAFVIYQIVISESDRWVRTDDPTVLDLIEKYEKLPPEKQDIIRDIADDG